MRREQFGLRAFADAGGSEENESVRVCDRGMRVTWGGGSLQPGSAVVLSGAHGRAMSQRSGEEAVMGVTCD